MKQRKVRHRLAQNHIAQVKSLVLSNAIFLELHDLKIEDFKVKKIANAQNRLAQGLAVYILV